MDEIHEIFEIIKASSLEQTNTLCIGGIRYTKLEIGDFRISI